MLMRQASEWKGMLIPFPATLFGGIVPIFLATDWRREGWQLAMMLTNRFGLFVVGYLWFEDRRTRSDGELSAAVTATPGLPGGSSASSCLGSVLQVMSLLMLSVLPTMVAIMFIFLDWTPRWMLVVIQIVLPISGFYEGVRYRSYIVRRGVRSRWKMLQLVGDE